MQLLEGDCVQILPTLPAESFDSVVTDPPYEIGFMSKSWDRSGVAFDPATWAAVLRVMKPGAYLLAFGGTRTYHRLTCAIEDAGFEIRDCLNWLYGTGFPKGAGCLKPGWEPIVLARKPGAKVLPLGIEECRIPVASDDTANARKNKSHKRPETFGYSGPMGVMDREWDGSTGRYPANVAHDGSDEVMEAFAAFGESPGSFRPKKGDGIGCGYGNKKVKPHNTARGFSDTGTAARFFFEAQWSDEEWLGRNLRLSLADIAEPNSFLPSGPVASALSDAATSALPVGMCCECHFPEHFTSATPSELRRLSESVITVIQSTERRFWLGSPLERSIETQNRVKCAVEQTHSDTTTITTSHWKSDGSAAAVTFSITPACSGHGAADSRSALRFNYCAKASKSERGEGNTHPTVKPLKLCEWLVRLICPEGGTVLDPFAGSGTTLLAAHAEGREATGVELGAGHCEIIRKRLAEAQAADGLFAGMNE